VRIGREAIASFLAIRGNGLTIRVVFQPASRMMAASGAPFSTQIVHRGVAAHGRGQQVWLESVAARLKAMATLCGVNRCHSSPLLKSNLKRIAGELGGSGEAGGTASPEPLIEINAKRIISIKGSGGVEWKNGGKHTTQA
jgi:hypothetical protein